MDYLIGHLVGDYLLQTEWQAVNKKTPGLKGWLACLIHCSLWTLSVSIFYRLVFRESGLTCFPESYFTGQKQFCDLVFKGLKERAGKVAADCLRQYNPSGSALVDQWICGLARGGVKEVPKLLIVDDEPYIRILLEQTLEEIEDEGVELFIADNGLDALKIIQSERPGLVFLDVMMPKMNGFEVCNAVKNELGIKGVYIIMLTAKGQEFDKEKGNEVGADIYMTKPFNPDEILERARGVLGI